MNRLLCGVVLISTSLAGQSLQSTLLALKDATAPRTKLTKQLTDELMALAKPPQTPSRITVEVFSSDLAHAIGGRDLTAAQASAMQNAMSDVMAGKGAAFLRTNVLWQELTACGVESYQVRRIVDDFTKLAQDVRGPDDAPVRGKPIQK
jgi:hypothetical protein